jgi:hypothetical protein
LTLADKNSEKMSKIDETAEDSNIRIQSESIHVFVVCIYLKKIYKRARLV